MGATDRRFGETLPLVRPLDDEQARLVEILLAAGGADVSFEELRRQGIENPAVLAYELEIAGLPISHVHGPRPGGGPTSVGLSLDATVAREASSPGRARETGFTASVPATEAVRAETVARARRDRGGDPHGRHDSPGGDPHRRSGPRERARPGLLPVAVTAVAAFVLIVLVVALIDGTGGGTNQPAKLALEGSHTAPSAPATHQLAPARPPAGHARHHASGSPARSIRDRTRAPAEPGRQAPAGGS